MKIRPFILAILAALMASLFSTAPLSAQVTSSDTTFTPSILKSGLSTPSGIAFRRATNDLVVTQTSAGQVSLVNASSGATKNFVAQPSANEVAVRTSDGLIAIATDPGGPIDFYTSSGAPQGSVASPNACIGGLAFDNSGNLFVAAGPFFDGTFACSPSEWSIYEFPAPVTSESSPQQIIFEELDQIEGLTFSAATPQGSPDGTGVLYAVSPVSGNVYQISQSCDGPNSCSFFSNNFAQVPSSDDFPPAPSGIAVDPFSGNIYISELTGTSVIRFSPPDCSDDCSSTLLSPFASGFTSSYGLTFDRNGNLYVNDTNAGNVWKFSRAAFSTPEQAIVLGQPLTFTNQTKGMTDQVQTMFFPLTTSLCNATGCAASIRAIFVPFLQSDFDAARFAHTSMGSDFFGGGPVFAGSMCTIVPSANPNPAIPANFCLVTLQVCSDALGNDQPICSVHVPSTSPDRILLTSSFNGSDPPGLFGIDFDAPTSDQTVTNVTIQPLSGDPNGSGGPRTLCSGTFFYSPPTNNTTPDFSLGPIPPPPATPPITVPYNGMSTATVPVTSANGFASTVTLGVADVPAGVTATLNQGSVILTGTGTDTSTMLTVSVGSSFDSATTIPGIETVIANLLTSGCIDNSGTANGLTSKLSAAQADINAGRIQDAINVLGAFKSEDQAQAGKHIGTSCTATFTLLVQGTVSPEVQQAMANVNVTGTNASTILAADATTVITSLAGVNTPDPVTGYVQNNGAGVSGATVSLLNALSLSTVPGIPTTTTDGSGFYYFANTPSLTKGVAYTVQVTLPFMTFTTSTPPSQTFTWAGKGLALAIFNLN